MEERPMAKEAGAPPFRFELLKTCRQTGARLGLLHTPHG